MWRLGKVLILRCSLFLLQWPINTVAQKIKPAITTPPSSPHSVSLGHTGLFLISVLNTPLTCHISPTELVTQPYVGSYPPEDRIRVLIQISIAGDRDLGGWASVGLLSHGALLRGGKGGRTTQSRLFFGDYSPGVAHEDRAVGLPSCGHSCGRRSRIDLGLQEADVTSRGN